jgi:hypothetical protein
METTIRHRLIKVVVTKGSSESNKGSSDILMQMNTLKISANVMCQKKAEPMDYLIVNRVLLCKEQGVNPM